MTTIPDRATFETLYAGQAPWDIGKPHKVFVDVADRITGSVLDAGCGSGDTALFLASRGNQVTGIDFLEEPIRRAKLKDWTERFGNVIDSGLFHVFSDEDRKCYADGLATVLNPGGRLYLMCFSDEEPGTQGPRRVSKKELHAAFAQGWDIESIEPTRVETRPDLKEFTLSEGGPKVWFAVIRRAS